MRTWWTVVLLAACATPELAVDQAPPPVAHRVPYAQVSGLPLRFRLETPAVTARMRVYAALHDAPGACAPGVPVVCIQLDQPVLLADVPLDPSGTTQVEVPWPAWLDGESGFYVQLAVAASRTRAAALAVTYDPLLAPTDDSDHDGLSASQEHALSLRMDRADSDGGGSLDGQEVADGTDPRAVRDDRLIESLCGNGLDDDVDGLADCEDGDCADTCVEADCADGRDEDFDGAIDCVDDDCWTRDCVDRTLAWTTQGSATTSWESTGFARGAVRRHGNATGLVRAYKGAEQRLCQWHAQASTWYGTFHPWTLHSSFNLPIRVPFEVDPPCEVGSEVLPPLDAGLWSHANWYGPQAFWAHTWGRTWSSQADGGAGGGTAGPLLNPVAFGACPGGAAPVLAWPDLDADGFGMSEAVDLNGAAVDRLFFCGAVPAGFTRVGGDCDDLDPTWTPGLVVLDAGTSCADLSPSDLDGDGVSRPADPDDRDARTWGQEILCGDGVDNDLDGLVDCEDGNCINGQGCAEVSCHDYVDNDQDGQADCADSDCWGPNCNTSTVAWLMRGSLSGRWTAAGGIGSSETIEATGLVGRIRTVGPQGTNTCSWTADRAEAEFGWRMTTGPWFSTTWVTFSRVGRDNLEFAPGCYNDARALPTTFRPGRGAVAPLGWYGPLTVASTQGSTRMVVGGPALEGGPFGCYRPTRYYTDADHDGYGVSDSLDMHGALGGLHYACGAVPAGGVTVGGDCDDGDATWSPALIQRAAGVDCTAVRPDDRDGDGVPVGVDPNDATGAVR